MDTPIISEQWRSFRHRSAVRPITTGNRRPTDLRQSPTGDTYCSTRGRLWAASAGWSACAGIERSRCSRFLNLPSGHLRSRGLRSGPEKLSDSEAVAGNLEDRGGMFHSQLLKLELKSLKKVLNEILTVVHPEYDGWGEPSGGPAGENQ